LELTLTDIGKMTNLSPAFLSRIERGEASTSIGNLIVISNFLGITIPELFETQLEATSTTDFTLSRARQRETSVPLMAGEYSFYRLCSGLKDPLLNAFELVFPVGSSRDFSLLTHEGQEIFYILEGEIEFQIGSSIFKMEPGDCLNLNSRRPHMGRNIGQIPVRALMIVTPWGAIEDRFVGARVGRKRAGTMKLPGHGSRKAVPRSQSSPTKRRTKRSA
jgi:mannose-6-phosphate isomerase-like protein (cupin superfamily)